MRGGYSARIGWRGGRGDLRSDVTCRVAPSKRYDAPPPTAIYDAGSLGRDAASLGRDAAFGERDAVFLDRDAGFLGPRRGTPRRYKHPPATPWIAHL